MNGKLLILALTLTSGAALAAPPPPERPPQTAQWLRLQRSGEHAGRPNALAGGPAERAYQRYLKSFENEIPKQIYDNRRNGG